MADNLKKVKRDRQRIALKQKHEMEYMRKIAREILEAPVLIMITGEGDYVTIYSSDLFRKRHNWIRKIRGNVLKYSCEKNKRLAKAFLKLSTKGGGKGG